MINEKAIQDKISFHPHKAQQEILSGLKRFSVICAGTRFGKSAMCAYIALRRVVEFYSEFNSLKNGATKEDIERLKKGLHIWVVAPTYDLSKKIYSYLSRFTGDLFPTSLKGGSVRMSDRMGSIRIVFRKTKDFPVESWIEFKSTENPTGLLGEELDLCIIDECSRTKKEVWESFLYSRLTSRKGSAVFISTPFGKNWFYHEWIKGQDPEMKEYSSFHYTSLDNPYFPPIEWENAKKRLPTQVFKQEHEAVFLDDAASVFRSVRAVATAQVKKPVQGHYYSVGVDLGKREDFTVITIIDKSTHCVVYHDRFKELDWGFQKSRIYAIAKKYNNGRITIDSTGIGDPITDDLRRMGLSVDDYRYTNKSKGQLIDKLAIFIEQKRVFYPFIPVLIDELEAFGYRLSPSGNTLYSAPEGLHDDCVNSLALAVWSLPDHPVSSEESTPIIPTINDY